ERFIRRMLYEHFGKGHLMAQPVLLDTEIELDAKALASFDERPRPRRVAAREPRRPRYPGESAVSRWHRYSDWWAWGAAALTVVSVVALFAWG
ncbi:MAG: hypothetical protein AAGA81_06425, partial [Acidobacteriota bacterium]